MNEEQTKGMCVWETHTHREREAERGILHPSWWEVWDELRRAVQTDASSWPVPPPPPPFLSVSLFFFLSCLTLVHLKGKCTKPIRKSDASTEVRPSAACCGKRPAKRGCRGGVRGTAPCLLCSAQPAASLSGLRASQDVDQNAIAHCERAWHRECKCLSFTQTQEYRRQGARTMVFGSGVFFNFFFNLLWSDLVNGFWRFQCCTATPPMSAWGFFSLPFPCWE